MIHLIISLIIDVIVDDPYNILSILLMIHATQGNPNYIKIRSRSMQSINKPELFRPQQKSRYSKQKKQQINDSSLNHTRKIVDLQNLKNKQEELISSKIKVLAQRSMKKLQQRYETIDRWKQKYVSQSAGLLKNKLLQENSSSKFNIQEMIKRQISAQNQQKVRKGNCLLPVITKKHVSISPSFDDHKEQGRKLQAMLKDRLQKNRKYYQLKSTILEKEINYFQDLNIFVPPEKKREIELRKLVLKSEKEKVGEKKQGLFYKKLSLQDSPKLQRRQDKMKVQLIQKLRRYNKSKNSTYSPQPDQISTLNNLKSKLFQQIITSTPQGWQTQNPIQSPQQQDISS